MREQELLRGAYGLACKEAGGAGAKERVDDLLARLAMEHVFARHLLCVRLSKLSGEASREAR